MCYWECSWLGVRRMLRDEGLAICCWECSWLGLRRMLRNEGLAICCWGCSWLGVRRMLRIRRTPSQLHFQQHISTQRDMLPQHPVYKNELDNGCYNITLARKNIAP